MKHYEVLIGLGSNLGDKEMNIVRALEMLDVKIEAVSSLYLTSPVGFENQPDFLNAAAQISTTKAPEELLEHCLDVENVLGRVREVRWGPRIIDIDILLVNSASIHSDKLTVPHPRMLERAFVMVPLAEIAPDYLLPNGVKVSEAAEALKGQSITVFQSNDWKSKWQCSDMKL